MGSQSKSAVAKDQFGDIAPDLADLTDGLLLGDIWQRETLSPRDRSMVTVAALIAMGRSAQLEYHLGVALENGVTRSEIVEVLTHLAFYSGWPTAVEGVGVARKVFAKHE